MKRTDDQENGNSEANRGAFTTQVTEENPYLQRMDHRETSNEEEDVFNVDIEEEEGPPIELEDDRRKEKQRRRMLAMASIATCLLLAILGAVAIYHRTATKVEYGRTTKQGEVLPPAPTASRPTGRDSRTEKAIEEAQRLTVGQGTTSGTASNRGSVATDAESNSRTFLEAPFKVPTGSNETINAAAHVTDSRANTEGALSVERRFEATPPTSASYPKAVRSQRSSESSLYMKDTAVERAGNPLDVKGSADSKTPFDTETKIDPITVPAFASMLPVRSIGALYTLRTGALVRFELTRDTKGDGWSMKRGTILVGTSKASDFDRAYVSLIGFIDPQSGKLVKLGGEVLGGDGAAGLKGKRRQLDGGWARVLGRLGSAALDVTGALLSGRGRDTVIISDGIRSRAINPVTDEISGVLGSELDRRQGRSFVEVMAGTPGYVMVTDLPTVIKGIEATPELNSETLASLTDVESTRPATGLSERELAELLANGSLEQIKAAMPRMSPEMRKIAATVLRP